MRRMTPTIFEATFRRIGAQMAKVVVGQEDLVFGLLVAAIAGGHILIEGAPGLGKTLVARSFAKVSGARFKRLQFTPDLMPSDVTGSSVLDREKGAFTFIPGPIFCQLLLADEINRAPAKTQSALLEAMQDHQVTVDGISRPLPAPFVVVATQNPVESQGTYPLPEAQLDRFLMKLTVLDPPRDVEQRIVKNHATGFDPTDLSALEAITSPEELMAMQRLAAQVRVDDSIIEYVVELARKTREDRAIELGASPRASIALNLAARAHAFLRHRGYVTPEDVKAIGPDVLRHRIVLTYEADAEEVTSEQVVRRIFEVVEVP